MDFDATKVFLLNGSKTPCNATFQDIYEKYEKTVFNYARKLMNHHYMGNYTTVDDIAQEMMSALMVAWDKYDIERNVQFDTYLIWQIRHTYWKIIEKRMALKRKVEEYPLTFYRQSSSNFESLNTQKDNNGGNNGQHTWHYLYTNRENQEINLLETLKPFREKCDDLDRLIFDNLTHELGYTSSDIARLFGKTRQTVSIRVKKMKKNLQDILEKED